MNQAAKACASPATNKDLKHAIKSLWKDPTNNPGGMVVTRISVIGVLINVWNVVQIRVISARKAKRKEVADHGHNAHQD